MAGFYEHIGVASTFSPSFRALLAEADRVAKCFAAPLSILHAAGEDSEKMARFREVIGSLSQADEERVVWREAESPADALFAMSEERGIDLLVSGALESEQEHRYFLGSVARTLLKNARNDILLVPKPSETAKPCSLVVVEVDLRSPNLPVLSRACDWATRLSATEMLFIGVVTPFESAASALVDGSSKAAPEDKLTEILDQVSGFVGDVDYRIVHSNTGFSVCDFVKDSGADLFIVGARNGGGVPRFPSHLDWLQQVVPSPVLCLV